jgi:hypothetical protein
MAEDSKDKIAKLVALKGIPQKEEEAAEHHENSHNTTHVDGGSVVNNMNSQGGDIHYHVYPGADEPKLPLIKSESKMDAEEKKAYHSGEWDGLERRERSEAEKEYNNALRRRTRRRNDRNTKIVHYTTVVMLFMTMFGSLAVSFFIGEPIK